MAARRPNSFLATDAVEAAKVRQLRAANALICHQFIDYHRDNPCAQLLCQVLEVVPGCYYAWCKQASRPPPSATLVAQGSGTIISYSWQLFALRRREPQLERPFVAPFYPWFPLLALALTILSLGAIVYYNVWLSVVFFAGLGLALAVYVLQGRHRRPGPVDALLNAERL